MALTKAEVTALKAAEVKVSEVALVDESSDPYVYTDLDGMSEFLTEVEGVFDEVDTLTGTIATHEATIATHAATINTHLATIASLEAGIIVDAALDAQELKKLIFGVDPLRSIEKFRNLNYKDKYETVSTGSNKGYPRENFSTYVYQWVLDTDEDSLVPSAPVCRIAGNRSNVMIVEKVAEKVIEILEAGGSVAPEYYATDRDLEMLEIVLAEL